MPEGRDRAPGRLGRLVGQVGRRLLAVVGDQAISVQPVRRASGSGSAVGSAPRARPVVRARDVAAGRLLGEAARARARLGLGSGIRHAHAIRLRAPISRSRSSAARASRRSSQRPRPRPRSAAISAAQAGAAAAAASSAASGRGAARAVLVVAGRRALGEGLADLLQLLGRIEPVRHHDAALLARGREVDDQVAGRQGLEQRLQARRGRAAAPSGWPGPAGRPRSAGRGAAARP